MELQQKPAVAARKRLQLTADHLSVHAGDKQLLHNVSAVVSCGRLLAVMGPSGSGKTTFLNSMSGRMRLSGGSVTMNNKPVSSRVRKSFGYVTQTDVFFPMLTLRETIQFAARVKLPDTVSASQRRERVAEVIRSLHLQDCMDTIIGNFLMPGLSGGEKKRANIACELLPNPEVLLLDEPTSGLDAGLALSLIEMLRKWSTSQEKIVLMSIHQPSSPIFHVFDDLLLLADGHTSYFGRREGMVDYFHGIGVPFEPLWNPADYMLEVVKASSKSKQDIIDKGAAFSDLQHITQAASSQSSDTVEQQKQQQQQQDSEGGEVNAGFLASEEEAIAMPVEVAPGMTFEVATDKTEKVSWGRQLLALTIRSAQVSRRRMLSPEPVVRTLGIGLISALIWFQVKRTEEQIRDILGCIFFLSVNLSFAPLMEAIFAFQEDLHVVMHERKAGMYQIGAYYLAKMLTEMPMSIIVPFVTLTVVFWTAGLGNFLQYLPFVATILINSLACQGIGLLIGLLSDIPRATITIGTVYMLTSLLVGGFFATKIPVYLVWLQYLSNIRYCFHFCMLTVFQYSENYLCATTRTSSYPSCINATVVNAMNQTELPASEILHNYPDTYLGQWWNFVIILVFFFVFRFAGYLWLRFVRKA